MKKLIICLALSVVTLGLQAGECSASKDAKPACAKAATCSMKKSSCGAKSCCAKSAPKVKSPKGAEQSGK